MSWKLTKKLKDTHLFGRSSTPLASSENNAPNIHNAKESAVTSVNVAATAASVNNPSVPSNVAVLPSSSSSNSNIINNSAAMPSIIQPISLNALNSQNISNHDASSQSSRPSSAADSKVGSVQSSSTSLAESALISPPAPQISAGTLILTLHEGRDLSSSSPPPSFVSAHPPSANSAVTPAQNGQAGAGGAALHFDPMRLNSRDLPYALVGFDNHQIFVNAVSGDSKNAMWAGGSTHYKFDVCRIEDMNISLYYRNPSARTSDARRDDILVGKCTIYPTFKTLNSDGRDLNVEWYELTEGHGRIKVGVKFVINPKHSLTIEDFELLKVVGKGSFGKVMQVKKIDTQRIYALKTIRKAHIISRSEVSHTLAERSVLAQINNPFIVPLKFSFQSAEKLYLVLAFVNGGELFHHLQREQRFDINRARFYAAELLCALECLHGFNVIYRDLKPENILLDYSGHIALCDFGLCKLGMKDEDRTSTFCGTPEYLAPELLTGGGYTKAVDWWTLGVLLYEMLVGLPPFYDENTNDMYRKILTESVHFPGPEVVPPAARDLLTRLLDKNAENRLGFKGGAAEIKSHYFFTGIDWRKLLERKYEPSFKPNVSSQLDTSNIDGEFTSEAATDSYVEGPALSQTVQEQFSGWSYNRPVAGLSDVGGSVRDPGMDQHMA